MDEQRSFLETYTPRNIGWEIANRLRPIFTRLRSMLDARRRAARYDGRHAADVGSFYDVHHEAFMSVYGPVIQAMRTVDLEHLLDYQIERMGLTAGQVVLDAGCGVCAPAVHFARRVDVHIDAITASPTQAADARNRIHRAGLDDRVTVVDGDYHRLSDYYDEEHYDLIYFLESFGHSRAKPYLLDMCWRMLRPGGSLYIKDLFQRVAPDRRQAQRIAFEIRKINEAYHYDVANLNEILDVVRRRGFYLESLQSVDLDLDAFEGLAISNEFQELTGIAPIGDWDTYVFPVDFFELRCRKPAFDLSARPDRHFLQNQAAMQAESGS